MAIGTAAAIIGGSALLAGGSALSASSSNKATNKAADTAAATARENNALTKDIYNQNKGILAPFVNTGVAAGGLLNDFYGIPQATGDATGAIGTAAQDGDPDYAAYVKANPDLSAEFQNVAGRYGNDASSYGQYHWNRYGQFEGRALPKEASTAIGRAPDIAPGSSKSAFANYIANSDYGFQQATGNNAVNSGFAGAGTVQSGAAMKALEKYRQNLQSGYRNEWAGGVANQQGVGLSAAGALAGVATNYANTVSASNTAASDARANAALRQQNIIGNAMGTFGSGILAAGSFGGFGGGAASAGARTTISPMSALGGFA